MKPAALALIVVCGTMLVTADAVPVLAAETIAEDVPVAGGVSALAALADVSPVPERARFVAELARVIYSSPSVGPYSNESVRHRIDAFFADARRQPAGAPANDEIVPIPLSPALWSQAIFHRQVDRRDLVGAILVDRNAALMCYGLAGLDDDTLRFFAEHPSLLSRLAERAPAAFAAFGESLRIRDGRVVPPGGEAAAPLWEAAVGEKLSRPERFVQVLYEGDRARLAYLFDELSHLDPLALAFALESSVIEPDERVNRFKRLAALMKRAFVEWEVAAAPFVRPPNALGAFFARLRINANGTLVGVTSPAFWQRAFEDTSASVPPSPLSGSATADAAWLTEFVLGHQARERERRLEAFTFAQRVFGRAATGPTGMAGQAGKTDAETDEAIAAVRGVAPFPALMLTLERMGIRTPSVYAAGIQQAERLVSLEQTRGSQALGQFQGALAFLCRLVRVGTIDAATGEQLARDLFDARMSDGRYNGAIAAWMTDRLRPALSAPTANATLDDLLLAAAAGQRPTSAAGNVEWEGQRYHVDIAGAELLRLMRVREKQEATSVELVLSVAAIARRLGEPATLETVRSAAATLKAAAAELAAGPQAGADKDTIATIREAVATLGAIKKAGDLSDARKAGVQLTALSDVMLGQALVSLAYALDLGDPDGTILIAGDPAMRHDFGYGLPSHDARVKAMWNIAQTETRNGPSHLAGSVLILDIAMAPLALRRINTDRVPEAPMLNLVQRDNFAATVAIMDARRLTDEDRDEIATRIDRGRRRVHALVADDAPAIASDAGFDGWRTRALNWTVRHDPDHVGGLFTMTELLLLGGGAPSAFDAWGTYALRTRGCLCSELAPPGRWRSWWGLSQAGLPAGLIADLALRVAVLLHNLHLSAVLAKPVLAAAMQDFVDSVNPTDGNDWLTLARAAQTIGTERFEDYVAAATADGPLLPDAADKQ